MSRRGPLHRLIAISFESAGSIPHLAALHWQLAAHNACLPAQGREVVAMARELLGGNGVVADFLVGKQFCDMEVLR